MEVTIKDIARICGVSVSTVSRALNHHPDINPETLAKINEAIKKKTIISRTTARATLRGPVPIRWRSSSRAWPTRSFPSWSD